MSLRGIPISSVWICPVKMEAPGWVNPFFGATRVAVCVACTAVPSAIPWSQSRPEGRSMDNTGQEVELMRSISSR